MFLLLIDNQYPIHVFLATVPTYFNDDIFDEIATVPKPALLALFTPGVASENIVDFLLVIIHQLVSVPVK